MLLEEYWAHPLHLQIMSTQTFLKAIISSLFDLGDQYVLVELTFSKVVLLKALKERKAMQLKDTQY